MTRNKKRKWEKNPRNFYQTDEWRQVRKSVILTYGKRCMNCTRLTESPHVDHIRPRINYPQLALRFDNLQVLCKECNEEKGLKIIDYRQKILTPVGSAATEVASKKGKNWQFFDQRNIDHNSGRSLTKEEIEKLGYAAA